VEPKTASPLFFSTATDSPVIMDSSTKLLPDNTKPSVGMRSPGNTFSTSPFWTRSRSITLVSSADDDDDDDDDDGDDNRDKLALYFLK